MADFLDVAEQLLWSGKVDDSKTEFELVFKALAHLQGAYAKASLDSQNLEAVYAAFEMAHVLGSLGALAPEEIARLPMAMRRLIVRTLEETTKFPVVGGRVTGTERYLRLAQLVKRLVTDGREPKPTVITFNYDLALDFAYYANGMVTNYSLPNEDGAGYSLLKLHGSINWFESKDGKTIAPWKLSEFFATRSWPHAEHLPHVKLTMTGLRNAGGDVPAVLGSSRDPIIVPPTWSKASHYQLLSSVWREARRALATAENIIVVGYSMPESDPFFRYLYALGTIGETRIKRFWVFDPGERAPLERRFRDLLGRTAASRFQIFPLQFDADNSNAADTVVLHELFSGNVT